MKVQNNKIRIIKIIFEEFVKLSKTQTTVSLLTIQQFGIVKLLNFVKGGMIWNC